MASEIIRVMYRRKLILFAHITKKGNIVIFRRIRSRDFMEDTHILFVKKNVMAPEIIRFM